jgi:hypothetical protein
MADWLSISRIPIGYHERPVSDFRNQPSRTVTLTLFDLGFLASVNIWGKAVDVAKSARCGFV